MHLVVFDIDGTLTQRIVVATSMHMTGTGSWNAVMVFGCKDNHVATLFADQALALAVDTADTSNLKLAYGDKPSSISGMRIAASTISSVAKSYRVITTLRQA